MLKKLRLKFIALNMVTAAAVIIVVFSAVVAINYQQSLATVREAMEASINDAAFHQKGDRFGGDFNMDNGGMVPREGELGDIMDSGMPPEPMDGEEELSVPPRIGGRDGNTSIPVAVYRLSGNTLSLVGTASSAYLIDDDLAIFI